VVGPIYGALPISCLLIYLSVYLATLCLIRRRLKRAKVHNKVGAHRLWPILGTHLCVATVGPLEDAVMMAGLGVGIEP
jgi:hypothetical protein